MNGKEDNNSTKHTKFCQCASTRLQIHYCVWSAGTCFLCKPLFWWLCSLRSTLEVKESPKSWSAGSCFLWNHYHTSSFLTLRAYCLCWHICTTWHVAYWLSRLNFHFHCVQYKVPAKWNHKIIKCKCKVRTRDPLLPTADVPLSKVKVAYCMIYAFNWSLCYNLLHISEILTWEQIFMNDVWCQQWTARLVLGARLILIWSLAEDPKSQ